MGYNLQKEFISWTNWKSIIIIFYLKILLSFKVGGERKKREIKRKIVSKKKKKIVIPQFGYHGRKEKCRNYFP